MYVQWSPVNPVTNRVQNFGSINWVVVLRGSLNRKVTD